MLKFNDEISSGQPTIRIGDRVPDDAVNLAYVKGPPLISSDTVELFDYSDQASENISISKPFTAEMFVRADRKLETAQGRSLVPVENLLVTSKYKLVDGKAVPLYYTYTPTLYHYEINPPVVGGYYAGQNIKVLDGSQPASGNYAIELEATATNNVWIVHIYSDFTSSKARQYTVQYSRCNGSGDNVSYTYKEIYASTPIYLKGDIDTVKAAPDNSGLYATERSLYEDGYAVYVSSDPQSVARSPVRFRWRAYISGDRYTPWFSDSVCNANTLLPKEYTPSPGYTPPYTIIKGTAWKRLYGNVRSLLKVESLASVDIEHEIWQGGSLTDGEWVADANSDVTIDIEEDGTLLASTTADTGQAPPDELGEIKDGYPQIGTDITIEGYVITANPLEQPGKAVNVAKLSAGATIFSSLDPNDYPTSSPATMAIDGKSVTLSMFSWHAHNDGIWYARSREVSNPPETPVTLTVSLNGSKTINRIEVVMGYRGNITKLEVVNGGSTTTIWANKGEVPAPLFNACKLLQGKTYRYDSPSPITCDQIKVTVEPTIWKTRDYSPIVEFLFGFLGLRDKYRSGMEVFEINAYSITSVPPQQSDWKKRVSFGVTTRKGSPVRLNMREVLAQHDLLPPAGVNTDNVRYKIWLGDRLNPTTTDYHAAAVLVATKERTGNNYSFMNYITIPSAQVGDDSVILSYNDIMADGVTSMVSVESSLEELIFSRKFTIADAGENRIYILPFTNMNPDEMWCPRINNGRTVRKDFSSNTLYDYYIPEFGTQPFYPYEPYMYQEGESATYISSTNIRVSNTPLHVTVDGNGQPENLAVYKLVSGSRTNIPIVSWNIYTGDIYLETSISTQDAVYCDYSYIMTYHLYKGYGDPDLDKFFYLDLNPMPGHTYTYPLNESGGERPSSELLGKDIYIYVMPSFTYNYETRDVSGLTTTAIRHIIVDSGTPDSNVISSLPNGALLLGKIVVRRNVTPSSIRCIDTRRRGGGVKESISQEVLRKGYPSCDFLLDIHPWDGLPYPCNSVIEVEVPSSILVDPSLTEEQNATRFTQEQIREIVERHIAYGTYVFIHYI